MMDLTAYKLVFSDEFETLSLNTESGTTETWRPVYYWGDRTLPGNGEKQLYVDPSWNDRGLTAHSVEDGVLSLTASKTPIALLKETGNLPYVSAMINSEQAFSQQYGYFEMRAQLPAGQGFWPAFWMLPLDGSWPAELDVMEVLGHDTSTLYTTIHSTLEGETQLAQTWQGDDHFRTGNAVEVADMSAGFHNYGVDWQKDKVTFYFDGVEIFQTQTPADMHEPMYLLANLAVGGYWPGDPDGSTSFPSSLQIDHIRAYQAPVSHTVLTEVPASWTPVSELAFGTIDGSGATSTWDFKTVMSDTQEKLKMEGDWARIAIGNARDNWIEGGPAQYQEYHGNGGNNVFKGGSGIDVFKIRKGEGNDTILDFSNVVGNADKVYLDGFHFSHFEDVKPFLTQLGDDVILQLDADQGLKFANLTIDQLAPQQFAFFNTTAPPVPAAVPVESLASVEPPVLVEDVAGADGVEKSTPDEEKPQQDACPEPAEGSSIVVEAPGEDADGPAGGEDVVEAVAAQEDPVDAEPDETAPETPQDHAVQPEVSEIQANAPEPVEKFPTNGPRMGEDEAPLNARLHEVFDRLIEKFAARENGFLAKLDRWDNEKQKGETEISFSMEINVDVASLEVASTSSGRGPKKFVFDGFEAGNSAADPDVMPGHSGGGRMTKAIPAPVSPEPFDFLSAPAPFHATDLGTSVYDYD